MSSDIAIQVPHAQIPAANNRPVTEKSKGAGSGFGVQSSKANEIAELNDEQKAEVDRLKKVDQEVRAHEAAHKNAGGQHAGSASFTYTVGPDGKRYATGGEVPIDVAPVEGDPEATIAKLDVVIAAALAPAKPSAQDRKVAAAAVAARNQARAELLEQKKTEQQGETNKAFDVNDFGKTNPAEAHRAYETGRNLNEDSGQHVHNVNIAG